MLLAHDVSGVHPLSCLSLSQREAIPSPGQIQRILGKSDGRGNLPGLHPIRPITVIRPSAFPTVGPPKLQSASRHPPAAVVSPNSWILASLPSNAAISKRPRHLNLFALLGAESLGSGDTLTCRWGIVVQWMRCS